MSGEHGLVFAWELDGRGGGREVGWDFGRTWPSEQGLLWMHLDYGAPEVERWVVEDSGLDPVVGEALISEDPRPRSLALRDGLLVILRGVNLNPGADPEDMVSLRLWIEEHRVLSFRRRRVIATEDLNTAIASGSGPEDAGDFLVQISDALLTRMAIVLSDLDDAIDAIEEDILEAETGALRPRISDVRRQAISLRRYLAPQRDTMSRLKDERVSWLDDLHRGRLRELGDRTLRCVEDLDADRDRAAVTHEELDNRLSEQLNRRMYALSVIAGLFLPLSFATGLLGINVGGIPGTDSPIAFAVVCGVLGGVAAIQIVLFRWLRWL